jgi:type II secretory pathway component GspD/PulD (secretin)
VLPARAAPLAFAWPRAKRNFTWAVLVLALACPAVAQSTLPASATPAAVPSTRPAVRTGPVTVESLMPTTKIRIDVSDEPVADLAVFIAKSYGFRLIDPYRLQQRVTIKLPEPVGAADAIKLLDDTLLSLGYTVLRSVQTDPPPGGIELRITTASKESGLQVFTGSDANKIPASDELRTQVIPLQYVDPEKARDLIAPVLDAKADVLINPGAKTLIITDTANRIRTAASLISVLEKQAAEKANAAPGR